MNRNVEIKAKISDPAVMRDRIESMADSAPTLIVQEDIFFNNRRGRLKLRKFSEASGELIYYERPDTFKPAESKYIRSLLTDPVGTCEVLRKSLGIIGVVHKKRILYRIGQTRVHLDEVESLGSFIELEVILKPSQDQADGCKIAWNLMKRLGIPENSLVDKSYIDLHLEQTGK